MIHTAKISKGLHRIRSQFLVRLTERRGKILFSTLEASSALEAREVAAHLNIVRDILHQIAGSAGILGFADFGLEARRIENDIGTVLEHPERAIVSSELIEDLIAFTKTADVMILQG